jgi:dihydropteroate synthase
MFTLNCNGRLVVGNQPLVMGIINSTPDSFYQGSRQQSVDAILRRAGTMLSEGADIIDVGGQSSRPGSKRVTEEEELLRVMDGVVALHREYPSAIISIDTFYANVAREAVAAGASIVNDISAGSMDPKMISTVGSLNVPYVLMHMKGTPQTMQQSAVYENVGREVLDFLAYKIPELKSAGIRDIIIDPGFGFGKTIEHNLEMLNHLELLKMIPHPLLCGMSRKATIWKTLGISAEDALNGTTVLNTVGLLKGADILRVHDVREAKEAIRLVTALGQG